MAFMRCSRISPGAVRPSVPRAARVSLQFCLWRTMIRIDIIRCSAVQHLSSGRLPRPNDILSKITLKKIDGRALLKFLWRRGGGAWCILEVLQASTRHRGSYHHKCRWMIEVWHRPLIRSAELVGCEQSCWQAEDACNSVLTPTSW
jgi:hypothetical protein